MSSNLIEKILGNNSLLTESYIDKTINLVKSITIVTGVEASLYNEIVESKHGFPVNKTDKRTWRYYLHLVGEYHPLDVPIKITSKDTGKEITLTKESIDIHLNTRTELLNSGKFYYDLINNYPEQELLIKTIINISVLPSIEEVISYSDFKIVSFNSNLVEEGESSLIDSLQARLNNYIVTKGLTYYSNAESLYMASLYTIIYQYLVKSLISLRLKKAKTSEAHSFHIVSYFSSNKSIDTDYDYLEREQSLFLYRNLNYLKTYSGTNAAFDKVVFNIFNGKAVSVLGYKYQQLNSILEDGSMDYRFSQKSLNGKKLLDSERYFNLEEIEQKEITIVKGNEREYEVNRKNIDFTLSNTLHSDLDTKDLEVKVSDNSGEVKYTLEDTVLDYWAQSLNLDLSGYIINLIDPVEGKVTTLSSEQTFKLFTIVLHYLNNERIETIPDYQIVRVIKPILPTYKDLRSRNFKRSVYIDDFTKGILLKTPSYGFLETPYKFEKYLFTRHEYNLGCWLFISNVGDKDTNSIIDRTVEDLHYSPIYKQGKGKVLEFLELIGYNSLVDYSLEELGLLLKGILKAIAGDLTSGLEKTLLIQKTLVNVLDKFKSYSTQIYRDVDYQYFTLVGPQHPFTTLRTMVEYRYDAHLEPLDYIYTYSYTHKSKIELKEEVQVRTCVASDIFVDLKERSISDGSTESDITVVLHTPECLYDEEIDWVVGPVCQDRLLFLSINQ